ncbi:hypothetical protein ARMGADRAFT_1085583 [Armillaria gallica]|uniref:HhH-GPD domain-containing protein n=1 Tax=Armillaria gallica TaxID=47427 RepID=A0A2H3D822_ARMGA|nr:hypothetical protein ARMGADRAFT_1085583 [Armillaria gallica]
MLSSHTKDRITGTVIKQLHAALGSSVSVQGIIDMDDSSIAKAITKVGFWRWKTQYVKQTAIQLQDEFVRHPENHS